MGQNLTMGQYDDIDYNPEEIDQMLGLLALLHSRGLIENWSTILRSDFPVEFSRKGSGIVHRMRYNEFMDILKIGFEAACAKQANRTTVGRMPGH